MQKLTIYISEPDVIDTKLVSSSLGDTPHTLVLGSTDFTAGNPSTCDTVIIRSRTTIDSTIRGKMPKLARIARVGTGLDNVDLDFCHENGIAVYNAAGANAEAVADYVIALSMMAIRKLYLLERKDIEDWNRFKFAGRDIASQTVGIVGFGNVGRLVYDKFRGLGCHDFIIYDPFVKAAPEGARLVDDLNEVLKHANLITLHVPLLPSTKYCVGGQNLGLLQKETILLNASRGGIVDEHAVLEALESQDFVYITDTVENEPHVEPALLDHKNVIITPHMASLTAGAENGIVTKAIANLLADKQAVVVGA